MPGTSFQAPLPAASGWDQGRSANDARRPEIVDGSYLPNAVDSLELHDDIDLLPDIGAHGVPVDIDPAQKR